ncbi:MAG TPA: lysophospholipid acyltransferase family protein [Desulfohalobiaceae bacterium]|nr:lysophospholipid acyltransferase family protein [Desulfohalobiaceae bacterium]
MINNLNPCLLGSTLSVTLRLWGRLLRYEQYQYDHLAEIRKQRQLIYALWHDELFVPCYFHRNEGIIAVVSASKDGEILAQVMKRLGYNLARGSSNRAGLRALREVYRNMQTMKKDAVFTVDGPKGPRHLVKEGILYLAHKTKTPIAPLRTSISSLKRFEKSWDKFQLPLPGAKCRITYGQPYTIEHKKLNTKIIEEEKERLKAKLDSLSPTLEL